MERPLEVIWDVTKPTNGMIVAGREFEDYDGFLTSLRGDLRSGNRNHSHPTNGLRYTAITRYVVPAGFSIELAGPSVSYACEFGSLARSYTPEGDSVTVATKLEVPRNRVSIEDMKRFNRFIERALADSRHWMRIARR